MYTFRKEKLQILIEMATFAKQNKRIITYLSTFEKINNLKTFSVSIQREQYNGHQEQCANMRYITCFLRFRPRYITCFLRFYYQNTTCFLQNSVKLA